MTAYSVSDSNLFAYCGNNPVIKADINGEWAHLVIGAAVGGLISGTMELMSQAASGNDINWAKVGVAALSGAASGLVASTSILKAGQIALNAIIGVTSYCMDARVSGTEITLGGAIVSAATGAVSGAIGGDGLDGRMLANNLSVARQGVSREARRFANTATTRGASYALRQTARHRTTYRLVGNKIGNATVRFVGGGITSRGVTTLYNIAERKLRGYTR